jgi:parallel beta-helix repeat protein
MHKYYISLFSFLIIIITGCGGGDAGVENTTATPENTNKTFVNVNTGLDTPESGTSRASPYKTISYALTQPTTKNTVEIAVGLYNAESGEQFPIVIPADKKLIGESSDFIQQQVALITGSGSYNSQYVNGLSEVSVVFDNALEIRNLVIQSENGTALWVENTTSNSVVNNIVLSDSQIGLTLVGTASPIISSNLIEQNKLSGIEVLGDSAPLLVNNIFRKNEVGILIADNAKPSFGNSTNGGGNFITENIQCDLLHTGIQSLISIGTTWDQDIFNFSITNNCANGAEIVVNGIGTLNYQFIPPKDNLIFTNTNRIRLDQPSFGEILFTKKPQFVWSGSNGNITVIAVWNQPPVIGINKILDTVPIYWFWHSGLKTGGTGFVQHSDGKSPLNGDINTPQAPKVFEVGRSYYWAAWEWDENGKKIIASSPLSYFRIN